MEQHPEFINSLIALKDYYQAQIEEYQRHVAHARKQLNHVNALLDDQMERQYKQSPPLPSALLPESASAEPATSTPSSTPATPAPPAPLVNWAVTESLQSDTAETATEKPPQQSAISEKLEPVSGSVTPELLEPSTQSVTPEQKPQATTEALQPPADTPATPEPAEPVAAVAAVSEPNVESSSESPNNGTNKRSLPQQLELSNDEKRSHYVPPPKTPLLPQYQHFTTKSEAVEKFLQDNEGKVFYIDDITQALYGELAADAIRAERPRIYDTLKKGVAKGLWSVVPNAANYYTIDLKSIQPTAKKLKPQKQLPKSPRQPSRRSKYSDSMLPRYRQLSFTEAVATVVKENAGQVLTPERVTRELYGDISAKDLTLFQRQVNKTLWAGAKQERWLPVPGQLGQYTLD